MNSRRPAPSPLEGASLDPDLSVLYGKIEPELDSSVFAPAKKQYSKSELLALHEAIDPELEGETLTTTKNTQPTMNQPSPLREPAEEFIDDFDPFAEDPDEEPMPEVIPYILSDAEKQELEKGFNYWYERIVRRRLYLAINGDPRKLATQRYYQRLSAQADYLEEIKKKREENPKPRRKAAKPYTTKYAKEYGRRLGWKVQASESYDHRLKRYHDIMLGMDVLFQTPNGLVAVQAAGKGEYAEHKRRFNERGGAEAARNMGIKCLYWVFERGNKTPIREEEWA